MSSRGLGARGVLSGVGDLSEAAWRKRLANSRAWLAAHPGRAVVPEEVAA